METNTLSLKYYLKQFIQIYYDINFDIKYLIQALFAIILILLLTRLGHCFNPDTDIIIELYTHDIHTGGIVPINNTSKLNLLHFNASNPTKFNIHGWTGIIDDRVRGNDLIVNAYLKLGKFNVFTVDWTLGSNDLNYITSRRRVNAVATFLAKYIDFVVKEGKCNTSNITLIGFSLGGHIAGLTAKNVKSGTIGTVIALDPAGPDFPYEDTKQRVASGDAKYVEVIHTNADILGHPKPLGDADFYPNGGKFQPGCLSFDINCSHFRSVELFAASLMAGNRTKFKAKSCRSVNLARDGNCSQRSMRTMGGKEANPNQNITGVFYLRTTSSAPFAIEEQ